MWRDLFCDESLSELNDLLIYSLLAPGERWPSGLRRWSRKPVWEQSHRGFESHPLRSARAAYVTLPSALPGTQLERCQSGRLGATGNRVSSQGDRGFESHSLRHPPTKNLYSDKPITHIAKFRISKIDPPSLDY